MNAVINFEYINLFMNRLIIVLINKKITIITLTVNIEIIHKSTHEFFQWLWHVQWIVNAFIDWWIYSWMYSLNNLLIQLLLQ